MPVAKRSRTPGRQAAVLAFAGLGAILTIIGLFVWLDNERQRGTGPSVWSPAPGEGNIFSPGLASELSEFIDETGPLLFADTAGRDRDVWIQHLGDDPTTGWTAFAVRQADATRECSTTWEPETREFADACSEAVYPADGTGLPAYEITVNGDRLIVDLVPGDEATIDGATDDDSVDE